MVEYLGMCGIYRPRAQMRYQLHSEVYRLARKVCPRQRIFSNEDPVYAFGEMDKGGSMP
jgi:hypothetical protein